MDKIEKHILLRTLATKVKKIKTEINIPARKGKNC